MSVARLLDDVEARARDESRSTFDKSEVEQ